MNKRILLWAWLMLAVIGLSAQDEPRVVTQTFVLENVTVVEAPGKVIEDATVVIKDGLIHELITSRATSSSTRTEALLFCSWSPSSSYFFPCLCINK